ncbi:hypothetical protein [Aminipila terrae]|uniref:Ethanolamine utilization protein n=1 Tax=Aminipila terrae TaxID=2697030 RepID=A0A6P1MKQ0_9FIRM|nr:hypothetical protein [Aminipila terrae]QHI72618.1 hypothetical protein Ami3637_09590 [Aminipila terrae]
MELDELVNRITAKVAEKISEMENKSEINFPDCEILNPKPKLLILSEKHETACHEIWENKAINDKFEIVCALNSEYQCNIQQFDVILLRNLSIKSVGQISQGMGETPFTEMVIKSILLGKKIIAVNEEVEVFQYRETAPKLYYGMMMQKIELLKNAGICFCSVGQLEQAILDNPCIQEKKSCCSTEEKTENAVCQPCKKEAVTLAKRVITERDIHSVYEQHLDVIYVTERAIITDLAREYAEQRGISLVIN